MKPIATRSKKREYRRRIAASLRWFAFLLVAIFVYWWVMANYVIRNFWDPQYSLKFGYLQARIAENPGHPLWLVMGGSRIEAGVRPELLLDRMKEKGAPILFNFGLSGADMFRQLVCLQRVLKDGVHPQRVVIEIIGPFMGLKESIYISNANLLPRARRDEMDEYRSYSLDPAATLAEWRLSRIDPMYKYGMKVPHQTLPLRLIPIPLVWRLEKHFYDKWGWVTMPAPPIPPAEYRRGFEIAKKSFIVPPGSPGVSETTKRMLGEIIDICKKEGIELYFLQMPEGKDFQALYPPHVEEDIETFLGQMQNEYGVRWINARSWLTGDVFTDGHHLNANGGEQFTRMLMDELSSPGTAQPAR